MSPSTTIPDLSHPATGCLIGVCGAGMKGLAELLADRNWTLFGADSRPIAERPPSLGRLGLRHLDETTAVKLPAVDMVLYSAAISPEHPLRQQATARNIPQWSYPDIVAALSRQSVTTCIAGTHGKTTTTALTSWILQQAKQRHSLLCGGEIVGSSRNGHSSDLSGREAPLIVESCEYRRHFHQQSPATIVMTGIEWDHIDCYPDAAAVTDAFLQFCRRLPPGGTLIVNADCPLAREVSRTAARELDLRRITFGTHEEADLQLITQRDLAWSAQFEVAVRPENFAMFDNMALPSASNPRTFTLPLPGRHNVHNGLAAIAAALVEGVELDTIDSAMSRFPGVKRRLERHDLLPGVTWIDDYAHHPTAVAAVLRTIRHQFPRRPLRVYFEPHQESRTSAFLHEFAVALSAADEVSVLPVYRAREIGSPPAVDAAARLVFTLRQMGRQADLLPSLDHAAQRLETVSRPGDVVATLGAGAIEWIPHEFSRRLPRHYAS
ncbi:MAG: Mur ligase family protein [Planctomycetaceae bacterium]